MHTPDPPRTSAPGAPDLRLPPTRPEGLRRASPPDLLDQHFEVLRGQLHLPGRAQEFGDVGHDRERVALLAALLHDIGHGPFSHAFEAATTAAGLPRRHEDWSAKIIQKDTEVNRVLQKN